MDGNACDMGGLSSVPIFRLYMIEFKIYVGIGVCVCCIVISFAICVVL